MIQKALTLAGFGTPTTVEEPVAWLLHWCQKNVADFALGYDDFEGRWYAEGVYMCVGGEPAYGQTAEEALASLVINYTKWELQFLSVGGRKD